MKKLFFITLGILLSIQINAQNIYWTQGANSQILRSDLNFQNIDTIYGESSIFSPRGLDLDISTGDLFWSQTCCPDDGTGGVYRGNINGGIPTKLFDQVHSEHGLSALGLDTFTQNHRLYFATYTLPSGPAISKIYYLNTSCNGACLLIEPTSDPSNVIQSIPGIITGMQIIEETIYYSFSGGIYQAHKDSVNFLTQVLWEGSSNLIKGFQVTPQFIYYTLNDAVKRYDRNTGNKVTISTGSVCDTIETRFNGVAVNGQDGNVFVASAFESYISKIDCINPIQCYQSESIYWPINVVIDNNIDGRNKDSLALVALYNSTDGPNWNTQWDLNLPMNNWAGITIGSCGRVTTIWLNGFGFNGSLPSEIGDLSELRWLVIWSCNLTGTIPPEIGKLSKLFHLQLGANNLTGQIPPEIGQLSNLDVLSLSWNNIDGTIPSTISGLSNLTGFYIIGNQLTGNIPSEINDLSSLEIIQLHDNNLSGALPVDLGNSTTLNTLYLHNNSFSGLIPNSWNNLCGKDVVLHGNSDLFQAGEFAHFCALSPANFEVNILENGGAESNFFADKTWVPLSGSWSRRAVFPNPQEGSFYFSSNQNAFSDLIQDSDLSTFSTDIDAQDLQIFLSGYQRSALSNDFDDAFIIWEFRDELGMIIDFVSTENIKTDSVWERFTHFDTIPMGTRFIRTHLISERNSGLNNDAYFDNISIQAHNGTYPSNVLYVDLNGNGNNGTNWKDGFVDLQEGLEVALNYSNVHQIWLAEGEYKPTSGNDRTKSFNFNQSQLSLIGGFSGKEVSLTERQLSMHKTVLSGDIGIPDSTNDNSYHVVTVSGASQTVSIEIRDLTIRNGNANGAGPNENSGGSIFIDRSSTFPLDIEIINCAITDNKAILGGAIFDYISSAMTNSTLYVESSVFSNNQCPGVSGNGGVLFMNSVNDLGGNSATYSGCTFSNNSGYDGGVFNITGTSGPTIINSLFFNNNASNRGGVIRHQLLGATIKPTEFIHCTLFNNNASDQGRILYSVDAEVNFDNCIMWGGSGVNLLLTSGSGMSDVQYSIVEGGNVGIGNIDVDPYLRDPAHDDYRLSACSPAINNGGTSSIVNDLLGDFRPYGFGYDIGAFEFEGNPFSGMNVVHVDENGIGDTDGSSFVDAYTNMDAALAAVSCNNSIDTICFAAGTYLFKTNFLNQNQTILLNRNMTIMGGYVGGASINAMNFSNEATIIRGSTGNLYGAEDSVYHMVFIDTASQSSWIENITFEGGFADGGGFDDHGGGIFSRGSATIKDVVLRDNSANGKGNAIFQTGFGKTLILDNVHITNSSNGTGQTAMENDVGSFIIIKGNTIIEKENLN